MRRYASGEDALAGLLEGSDTRPALIILDLNLPGIRGMEVLAALKGDPRVRMVPVIVLSGSSREEDIDAAYAAGANAYLSKAAGLHGAAPDRAQHARVLADRRFAR